MYLRGYKQICHKQIINLLSIKKLLNILVKCIHIFINTILLLYFVWR